MLGERHPDGEPARRNVEPTTRVLEGEPEERAVPDVHRKPERAPAAAPRDGLAEHGDVRVVAAKQPLVERLLQRPDRGGGTTGER